ncbi:MAG: 30S ribosomal protein S4 [Candidatus Hydrothermarchaeaceae archaeon]
MGDPKKHRKNFSRPRQLWQTERIERDKKIVKKHGLRNMSELWKAESLLRTFRRRARKLSALKTTQAEIEKKQLLGRLSTLNLSKKNASLDDVLAMNIEDVLGRRLQTIVQKSGLADTPKQARQFIVHGHIAVGGNKVTSPSYLVKADEEKSIKLRSVLKSKEKA